MTLQFLLPDGSAATVTVRHLLNGGYAGRNQASVQAHIDELAALGVPGPGVTPTLYPVAQYLAQQAATVPVQHARTSGEVEWAMVVADDGRELLTLAVDHTDRDLEVAGIPWSKNAAPDVLAGEAWLLSDVAGHLDRITLRSWVTTGGVEEEIQAGCLADLLPPHYWAQVLRDRGLYAPGTVVLSGTLTMREGVNQFAERWRAEMHDPATGHRIAIAYDVQLMAEPIC